MPVNLTGNQLKKRAHDLGASVVGFCRLGELTESIHPEIRETARKLPFAVSIGIALPQMVFESLVDGPNQMYKFHYRAANTQLDNMTWHLGRSIMAAGYQALAVPASMVLTRFPMIGHVNHREIAHRAGLGWRGKNNLLINQRFGSRLRLATVLTDLPLGPDKPVTTECGRCRACRSHCPAGAIGATPQDFDLDKCRSQVQQFCRENNFGLLICGLCLNCCPAGKGKNDGE